MCSSGYTSGPVQGGLSKINLFPPFFGGYFKMSGNVLALRLVKRGFESTQESDINRCTRPTVFTLRRTNRRLIVKCRNDQTRSAVVEGINGMRELPRRNGRGT